MAHKDKRFYVYVHKRKTDGSIFYVGKGRYSRHLESRRRNPHWINVAKKNGWYSEILHRFEREECAFSFEVALIAFIGINNLTNISHGGEGSSGTPRSQETRMKLRQIVTGKHL